MIRQLIIGAVSITSLFMSNPEVELPEEPTVINAQLSEELTLNEIVSVSERLQNMSPAIEESSESKAQRRQIIEQLEKEEQIRAEKEAEEKKVTVLSSTKQSWEQSIPTYSDDSPQGRFINEIARDAVEIAHENNIYPSVMIAQAGLESNWGRSGLAVNYNNLMGTKGSWNGKTVNMRTREDVGGQSIHINAGFSVYDSWGDSLARYGQLLRNGLSGNSTFYMGTWRENADSYKDASAYLQGRYATDVNYTSKLNNTIDTYDLARFDSIQPLDTVLSSVEVPVEVQPVFLTAPEGVHEVEDGDSLLLLSMTYDVSIEDLILWNNLETTQLEINQWVIIQEGITMEDINEIYEL